MESIWNKTVEIEKRPPLNGDLNVETAVIGAGMAGILTAFLLKRMGMDVAVLEADRIGSGQTKNTTAKITSQHGLIYDRLIRDFGMEKAIQYAGANEKAIQEYRNIIEKFKIDCSFEECPAYLYSRVERDVLNREAKAARALGLPAVFTTETELPFEVEGAVKFERQARFHPLEFLKAVAADVTVYEKTMVKNVDGQRLITDRGIVTAKHIVFACHYPFLNYPGYYFMRMHQERSYVLALEEAGQVAGMYLGIDEGGLSFRSYDKYLILGGGGHRTGENRAGGRYDKLRLAAGEYYKGSREVAHWSAQDCMTLDGLPYIGEFAPTQPDWYVATGFRKWGMTSSMVSAMIIRDLISGIENPYAQVFSPHRFSFSPSAKNLIEDGLKSAKGLTKELFYLPDTVIGELQNGHGGIVEYEGKKAGVYKNEDGEAFVVNPRCPHLGCQVEWNPDELSWDCPCHGSRFDYKGNLINNPAQEGLSHD